MTLQEHQRLMQRLNQEYHKEMKPRLLGGTMARTPEEVARNKKTAEAIISRLFYRPNNQATRRSSRLGR
ncbi:hypothetical protein IGK78_000377 [Enterococcus sp. DIV1371a]|uniref:hypothetical protein n=1 Tax=Enterococcus sp. DIV1371a TaxID=2774870 RepID=UPI003F1E7E67